jgi:sugar lactone lactonase YvrE
MTDPGTPEIEKLDSGLRFANGIPFGPDENLYVAVYGQGDVTGLSPAGEVAERLRRQEVCRPPSPSADPGNRESKSRKTSSAE